MFQTVLSCIGRSVGGYGRSVRRQGRSLGGHGKSVGDMRRHWIGIKDILGISVGYLGNIWKISGIYLWDFLGIYQGYFGDISRSS